MTSSTLPATHITACMRAVLDHADTHGLAITDLYAGTGDHIGVLAPGAAGAAWADSLADTDNPEYHLIVATGTTAASVNGRLPDYGVRIRLCWTITTPKFACGSCGIETADAADACPENNYCGECRWECRCHGCREHALDVECDERHEAFLQRNDEIRIDFTAAGV